MIPVRLKEPGFHRGARKNVEKSASHHQGGAPGEIGDGRIFVIPIEDAVRIRTGERGHSPV